MKGFTIIDILDSEAWKQLFWLSPQVKLMLFNISEAN